MSKVIDPWGSALPESYEKLITDFGLESYKKSLFPNPNRFMRRGIVFAGRDLGVISHAIANKKPYYVLSGIMPSAQKIHLGTKMVIENIKYFQENGATSTFVCVADLEALATRGISLDEAKKRALEFYIPAYIALGLDPKKTFFYFQSENKLVMNLAYEFAKKVTLNEFRAIYGIPEPGRIMSATLQAADILFPQIRKPIPGIIPIGADQDPHIRLTRDIVSRSKDRKLIPISSIYHKYMPALDGSLKMSKSNPDSMIELPDDILHVKKKIKKALTGGRDTLAEQRKYGAVIEKDMVFELLKQHLVDDDFELEDIKSKYEKGFMTSGEIKELACKKMEEFMNEFNRKLIQARKNVDELNFMKFN